MAAPITTWLMAAVVSLLVACGGGGGGDSAPGVAPGPAPPGQPVTPPPPELPAPNPSPYAAAKKLFPAITAITLNADHQAVVDFQLADGNNTAITDLAVTDVRFTLAKLQRSPAGNLTGNWQSYINRIEQPAVGVGTAPTLQATAENNGEFTNHSDGSYSYRFATSLTDLPAPILAQAEAEGLDLDFDSQLTHRVAIQFDNAPGKANPSYDWVPATGATGGIFTMDIAATANCNRCHDPLALHGGGRREIKYCVTCHNAGSTDANSTNTVAMKVMIHKIHRGINLPSVAAGGNYRIYGFRDSLHDYSGIIYPQDIRNCVNCHAGSATGAGRTDLVLTAQGDNWSQYASQAACGSCHDALDFSTHAGGQTDDSNCDSCHSQEGPAGSIQHSHRQLLQTARQAFKAQVLSVRNSMPGEAPVINFKVGNPQTGDNYDILSDPVFTAAGATLNVKMAWNTRDYSNTGNGMENANSVTANALTGAVASGDGSFDITMPLVIPNGSMAPGIAATGSGAAVIEGHPMVAYDDAAGVPLAVPVGDAHAFFSIDEADGRPVPRRQSVVLENCLACHQTLVLHGSNRADNIDSCVTCHNPRNTDREVRAIAATPPTDGKREESLHFKTMIHGIHAAAMRQNALQLVGFRGFSTYVYDQSQVHYPGDLANCLACHTDTGFTLPLPATALGTTVDTGTNLTSPVDDTVVTAATAACSSCHDDPVARAHMRSNGGSFATTQRAIDDAEVVEQCGICHAPGRDADIAVKHGVH